MKIEIRHQISETEEEIYYFEVSDSITYKGITFSNRNDSNDVFGYDWDKYNQDKENEINNLYIKYNLDSDDYDFIYNKNYQFEDDLNSIKNKYNPTCNKTIHGKQYLYGEYGYHVSKEHSFKISREQIIKAVCEKIKTMEVK